MYNLIVFLPLFGALLSWLVGDRWSSKGAF